MQLIRIKRKRKLNLKATNCVFLGYSKGVKGYRLWNIGKDGAKIIISSNVTFNENEFSYYQTTNLSTGEDYIPSVTTNKFQVKQREVQAVPTSMDNEMR